MNVYKILTISVISFLLVFLFTELFGKNADNRLLSMHPTCVASCATGACTGSTAGVGCTNGVLDCNLPCATNITGSCIANCVTALGWGTTTCNLSLYSQQSSTATCTLNLLPSINTTATCYKCTALTACACKPSCITPNYIEPIQLGVCASTTCPPTFAPSACTTCTGTVANPGTTAVTAPTVGTNATCGTSAGGAAKCSAPTTNLCGLGNLPAVSQIGTSYGWVCPGGAGSCGGASGSSITCTTPYLAAVNGNWSAWGAWGAVGGCSAACNWGTWWHTNTCSIANACGAQNCGVGTTQSGVEPCLITMCPVDGKPGECNVSTISSPQSGTLTLSDLCTVGYGQTATAVVTGMNTYTWTCLGSTGAWGGINSTVNTNCTANRIGTCDSDACCTQKYCGYKPFSPLGCDAATCYELDGFSRCWAFVNPDGSCTNGGLRQCVGR